MVDALAPDRSDQPFGEAVLPRRAWGGGLVTDAHGAQSACDGSAVDSIPIPDQVARSLIPREYFCALTRDPVRGRIRCGVDPDKVSAGQPGDDEDIEQIEANGRNNEQVHGGDVRCVVTQEAAQSLGRRGPIDLWTPSRHSAPRRHHITVYPRRTSSPILQNLIFGTHTRQNEASPVTLPHEHCDYGSAGTRFFRAALG